ncbi:MAG: ABC transporter substrate-binding protein, partial [Alphaproteobacteria bacterium]|nr:ABC transporter substrate-binding protein [Alphaproteobacteria bacterium]
MLKPTTLTILTALGVALAAQPVAAQQKPVTIVSLVELSGDGVTSGTNFRDGVALAVKEINAAGGILGRQIDLEQFDTQSNPGIAKALAQKAVDMDAYAVMGPVYSGSILVSMDETKRAGIPNFTGGEAASITQKGNPYIFRTSFTQVNAMPRVARYLKDNLHAKSVAMIWVTNDFGKGGHDVIKKVLDADGITVAADIPTDPGQVDFTAPVLKAKQANADAVFVYLNEDEAGRILRELKKQGYDKPIVGETTICGQKVIELAGDAANGAIAHVGLTADAPIPTVKSFADKFQAEYRYKPDHNGLKGYSAMYVYKAVIEKNGKIDGKAFADAMHGIKL